MKKVLAEVESAPRVWTGMWTEVCRTVKALVVPKVEIMKQKGRDSEGRAGPA